MAGVIKANSLNNNLTPSSGIVTGGISGNKANLFIFSPQKHTLQVVRPYNYAFTEELANTLVSEAPFNVISNMDIAPESIQKAIVPDSTGLEIDAFNLDNYYTFILTVDEHVQPVSMLQSSGPSKRSIFTGYFLDEPLAANTLYMTSPVINENAKMIFTHADIAHEEIEYGSQGMMPIHTLVASSDFVHQSMSQCFQEHVGFCDFSSLASAHGRDIHTGQMVRNGNPIFVNELSTNAAVIPETLKSPKAHLMSIGEAAQTGQAVVTGGTVKSAMDNEFGSQDMYDRAGSVMLSSLQRPRLSAQLLKLIDPTLPTILSSINQVVPNLIVTPSDVQYNPDCIIADPTVTSVSNIMSTMVANTVSTYCRANLLASIKFRYNSWSQSVDCMKQGKWEIQDGSALLRSGEFNVTKQQLDGFKVLLETGLFPMLKAQYGEFDLMVTYDGTGDTVTALNYLDSGTIKQEFIVTHNRMGGVISPTVGGMNTMQNNQAQMTGLFNHVVDNYIGEMEPYEETGGIDPLAEHRYIDDYNTGFGDQFSELGGEIRI